MKLLIVIVNYRTPGLTIDCLKSIAGEIATVPGTQVVVTDNASGDRSAEQIAAAIDKNQWTWARFMALEKNGGFAYGNNRGIEPYLQAEDKPQYIYLLNPDTVVLPDALKELVKFMDAHPEVGIAGSRVIGPDGLVRNSAFRFSSPLGELESTAQLGVVTRALRKHVVAPAQPEVPSPTDWVSGASLLVRREVFEKIGLLDERYFMYYEETDFCYRAARAGWPTWYVPSSKIIHIVGQASGVTGGKRIIKRCPRYWFDSRHRFFRHNYGALRAIGADLLWATGTITHKIVQTLLGRPRNDPPWLLWDFIRYSMMSWSRPL